MSIQESIRLVDKGEIGVIEWDLIGEKVNKLNTPIMTRFKEILMDLKEGQGRKFKAVIITSKKRKIFMAGADIEEIKRLNKREEIMAAVQGGQGIMNMLEDLPMPVIASIHGACMGGGCELVLACDYRVCSDDSSTKIGLPEVRLGLIPGFGGCVRLPRVIGLVEALGIILKGDAVDGRKALKLGLVDECVPTAILDERTLKFAEEIVKAGKGKRRKRPEGGALRGFMESAVGRMIVISKSKKMVMGETKGHYPAPLKALDVVAATFGMSDRTRALEIEAEGFCEVAQTDVSKNLIELFFLTEWVKKQKGVADANVKPREVKNMGVLGAGIMGGGIAYVAADKGVNVRMKDITTDAVSKGLKAAFDIWKKKLDRRRITKFEMQQKMDHISGGLDYAGFKKMDVVVEAIVEDMEIKKKVISEVANQLPTNAIIATNTSSLSVIEMGKAHPRPENFVGMHFFNPVDKMPLVEVIRGDRTSDEVVATIYELSKKMGKMPVVVKDGPGFLVNRLLLPWLNETLFLLGDGMSVTTIDRYYTEKFGMPMGPCRLMDEVGLDVCVKVLKIFTKAFGSRIEMSPLAEKLDLKKRLGRKNGLGFYMNYSPDGRKCIPDASIYAELGLPAPSDKLSEKEVIERGMFAMINEASLALIEDRIVETAQEVDLAMIMGTGFPPFRGGLLKYADSLGSAKIAEELELYASQGHPRLKPAQPLVNMAKTNRKFYS